MREKIIRKKAMVGHVNQEQQQGNIGKKYGRQPHHCRPVHLVFPMLKQLSNHFSQCPYFFNVHNTSTTLKHKPIAGEGNRLMFIEKILATFLHATPATNYQNAGIYLEALEQSAPIHGHSLYPLVCHSMREGLRIRRRKRSSC